VIASARGKSSASLVEQNCKLDEEVACFHVSNPAINVRKYLELAASTIERFIVYASNHPFQRRFLNESAKIMTIFFGRVFQLPESLCSQNQTIKNILSAFCHLSPNHHG
jgi:hypothetical protein